MDSTLNDEGPHWVGSALARIAELVCDKGMCEKPFKWVNPNRLDSATNKSRVGREADARRKKYLPTQWALNAVAQAFFVAEQDRDLLVSAVCGLRFAEFSFARLIECLKF